MTTCLASLIRSGNSSSVISTRPASESNFQTRSFSGFSCGPLTVLYSVLVAACWLEPEIGVCQVLVQFGPESLLPIPGGQPSLGHGNQPSLPGLPLFLCNLIRPAPDGRLRTPQDFVLWYHSPILKNEISPQKSPPDLLENTRLQTVEGLEGDDLIFFWRPVRSSAYLLRRGLHLLAPGGNLV